MPREYTIEEIEAANLYPDDGRVPHVPFGFTNDKWVAFKAKMQPGDKIVDFSTSDESWEHLAGRAGYAIMRGDEVIEEFVAIMN
jgi:hypothetical protein